MQSPRISQYRASESADYINWGLDKAAGGGAYGRAGGGDGAPERMPGERDIVKAY